MRLSWKIYKAKNEKWFVGRKVRLLVDTQSSIQTVKAGTILTIVSKLKGFCLESPTCSHCGVGLFIRKVDPNHLELLPDELDEVK